MCSGLIDITGSIWNPTFEYSPTWKLWNVFTTKDCPLFKGFHRVLRWVLTLNISNSKKTHVFDSRIYIQITWYTQFLPA